MNLCTEGQSRSVHSNDRRDMSRPLSGLQPQCIMDLIIAVRCPFEFRQSVFAGPFTDFFPA